MRRMQRIVLLTTLAVIMPVLAGCADFDMDKLDVFHLNEKKKLPGDRQPLFPEGVPGVSQGVPQEYYKGNQQPTSDAALLPPDAPVTAEQKQAAAPAEEPKPAAKPQSRCQTETEKDRQARGAETGSRSARSAGHAASCASAPHLGRRRRRTRTRAPSAPWPAAPPPGTFTR